MGLKDVLFGTPISTEKDDAERVGPIKAVGILGLDALASAAYGPEALLTVLLPLGLAGVRHVLPLTLVIIGVLALVTISYRQTIRAYPDGGGAYTVAKRNLGRNASLLAAAALALDYVLNVAVAISAGVGALVSAVPGLLPHRLALCFLVLVVLTLVNLRGVRATGLVFLAPTYLFLGTLFVVIALGLGKLHVGHAVPAPAGGSGSAVAPVSVWLLARAFANGCTAMTGIEAVSNGTPMFHPPVEVGARRTLVAIVAFLVALLVGIAVLVDGFHVIASEPGGPRYESVLSRVTAAVVGRGVFYYVTMAGIVLVLAFSANTSFAGFPRMCRMVAADRFLPEPFVHRGRRLTFSHGIVVLAALAGLLLVVFGGITDRLIPLFAVGALAAFTISQVGMVAHWRAAVVRQGSRARRGLVQNAAGALATGATLLVVLASKLLEGAWISIVLVATMLFLFKSVRVHYDFIARVTSVGASLSVGPVRTPLVVVPVRRWDAVALKAMRFAIGLSDDVVVVQVLTGDREVDELTSRWDELAVKPLVAEGRCPPRLVVLRSEYRLLYAPLLSFVTTTEKACGDRPIAIVVPELVEPRWYHHFLHSHTASLMKAFLLFRGGPQTVIVNVPFYLRDWGRERRRDQRPSVNVPKSAELGVPV